MDDFMARAEADIMNYKKFRNISAVCNSETVSEKRLRSEKYDEESRLNGVSATRLHHSICYSKRNHSGTYDCATVRKLARFTIYLLKFEERSNSMHIIR